MKQWCLKSNAFCWTLFPLHQLIRYLSESKASHLAQININAAQSFPNLFLFWQTNHLRQNSKNISTDFHLKKDMISDALFHLRPSWRGFCQRRNGPRVLTRDVRGGVFSSGAGRGEDKICGAGWGKRTRKSTDPKIWQMWVFRIVMEIFVVYYDVLMN